MASSARRSAAASFSRMLFIIVIVLMSVYFSDRGTVSAQRNGFYATSCPNVESMVRSTMRGLFLQDVTAPAAMLRLLFHDCQVGGCDASITLDSGSDGTSELQSGSNNGIRRLDIIDRVKAQLEAACPATVSCADIIALAARDAVALNGGPDISISLGRLDGTDATSAAADSALPPPTISVSSTLSLFGRMGMSTEESVAILGAHSLGIAHCPNFVNRLYPVGDPSLNFLYANSLRARCPPAVGFLPGNPNGFAALDTTNLRFDNAYFVNIMNGRGLLNIDSELASDPRTAPVVQNFASNQNAFFSAFASGFVKLSNFQVLTGNEGEVRLNCHTTN